MDYKSIPDGTEIGRMTFDPNYQVVIAQNGQAVWYDRGRKVRTLGTIKEVVKQATEGKIRVTLNSDFKQ